MTTVDIVQTTLLVLLAIGLAIDIYLDVRALPHKYQLTKEQAADEGVALAEATGAQAKKDQRPLTSLDKAKIAVDWFLARCAQAGVKTSAAEARKLVEIRLVLGRPPPSPPKLQVLPRP